MPTCVFCDQDNPAGTSNCRLCAAPLPISDVETLSDEVFQEQLIQLVQQGQRVQAVAAYRRWTGVDLDQAQAAIENLERDNQFNMTSADADLEWQIIACLERGEKIAAVKLHRDKTGVSLKESKDAVEAIETRLGLNPGAESKGGCLGMLLVVGLLLACPYWFL